MFFSTTAVAESVQKIAAVQNRLFDRTHEISIRGGTIPDDPYNISYPLSLAYTYNFNEWLAWETGRATLYINQSRDLKQQLINDYSVSPSDFDYPVYAFHTSAVIKPTYGKDSWFNNTVIHHQTFFSLGGGLTAYQKEYNYGSPTQELAWSVRAGVGRKYFISPLLALSFEAEERFGFKAAGMENNLVLSVGLDFRFDLGNKTNGNQNLNSLYEYLERSE